MIVPTRNPRTALEWLRSGHSVRIDALNLADWLRHVRALAVLEAVGPRAVIKTTRTTLATVGMRALLAGTDAFASQAFED
ncbi:hypothetical protein HA520_05950 [Azotobacter chroococcum]|uniref:Uncharacterized protein n=1 Tax=Azotobacter chroococcum TaxID=353 RepID=A0AA43Z578_9GAMM|nr:hypothetical protein [Azotobacter chroococcum]NHN76830.1 hypothetical protein [Azotobacter chroococcum]